MRKVLKSLSLQALSHPEICAVLVWSETIDEYCTQMIPDFLVLHVHINFKRAECLQQDAGQVVYVGKQALIEAVNQCYVHY